MTKALTADEKAGLRLLSAHTGSSLCVQQERGLQRALDSHDELESQLKEALERVAGLAVTLQARAKHWGHCRVHNEPKESCDCGLQFVIDDAQAFFDRTALEKEEKKP